MQKTRPVVWPEFLIFSTLLVLPLCEAAGASQVDAVLKKDGQIWRLQGEEREVVTNTVEFAHQLKVFTNGFFTVGEGKPRELQEGQVLDAQGMLQGPDGSLVPVLDHIAMLGGKVVVVKDGQPEPLQRELALANGARVRPDGTITTSSGRWLRLIDGHRVGMDGRVIGAKDTATLKAGKVWVQKDGRLFQIQSSQRIVMNDGSIVAGDGSVHEWDGQRAKLVEGKPMVFEGAPLSLK